MAVMRAVGSGHQPPARAQVREEPREYVISLDVSNFTEQEIAVEVLAQRLTVRADQAGSAEDDDTPFRLHERLEESFRLPDDAEPEGIKVFYEHGTLEIHAPRKKLEPRRLPIEHRSFLVDPDAEAC